ncbi:MAG TPA: hypothetical protein VM733_14405 [Thermoanaerobaculia bacterium]|nr:hypothetical protein [Thermoanaerobaculia bacterium]
MSEKKKILLTSVFRPYASKNSKYNKDGDEEWLDYMASRISREPGPFVMSSYMSGTALTLIAANLDADVTVMGHPSLDEYIAELKKQPDFVGITFLIKGLGKLFPMIALARKHAPKAKVVIGGFGTMLHNLGNHGADFLCRGEGVSFFRTLIGQNPQDPVRQPDVLGDVTLKCFRNYPFLPRARYAELTHGFGCPHKCEFCTTSAYFGYVHIPFAPGRQFYDTMVDIHDRTGISYFYLYEEDLCLYKKSLNEWGGAIRDDKERTLFWHCFSTVKSLTSWDLEELVSMGLTHVWIGIESVHSPFSKSVGRDNQALFDDLHSLGITTSGSIMFGQDHQTPESLHDELDHAVSLYPSTFQSSVLIPSDGTKLRERLEAEGRLRPANYWDSDLYTEVVNHPAFKPGQLRDAVFWAYDEFYRRSGPTIHRLAKHWMNGAERFKNSPNEGLRRRAQLLAERARAVRPILLRTSEYLPPTPEVHEMIGETLGRIRDWFGAPTSAEEAQAWLVKRIFDLEMAKNAVYPREPIEPDLKYRRWISGREVPTRFVAAA